MSARPDTVAIWNEIIDHLVAPRWRDRARYWLVSPKRRDNLVDELYSCAFFDPRKLEEVDMPATEVHRSLGGKAEAIEFTPRGDAHGTWVELGPALAKWVGAGDDVLLYCPPNGMGYYESHTPGERYLITSTQGVHT